VTARTSGPTDRGGFLQRWGVWIGIGLAFVAFGLVGSGGSSSPLDPNGTGPSGAKALVLLLRQYGATVNLDPTTPGPGVTTALLLTDQLDSARRQVLTAWVRQGGRLVVADPASPLQPGVATQVAQNGDLHPTGGCAALGLGADSELSVGPSLLLRAPLTSSSVGCYGTGLSDGEQAYFVISVRVGAGEVIGLGGAGLWSNERLDQDDNAGLAVGLLTPGRVDLLTASPAGSGHVSAIDLLSPRLPLAVIQLLVAFLAYAWWRGRRLGEPVEELNPVAIAGSEITVAVGGLLARSGNLDAAGRLLRKGTGDAMARTIGLGRAATPEQIASGLTTRSPDLAARAHALLSPGPVPDEAALTALAGSLAQLRQEVLRVDSR
jgi:hypothetical protein